MSTITVTVDGTEVEVPRGSSVLQACEAAGAEVPRFCYHDRLSVAGNCRMCLVDVEMGGRLGPKPTASCASPAADGMVVHTKTDRVIKGRKGVMEFLLINHPLDCPICDQGGECDLQDQAMAYGFDRSRYQENKRAVADKYMGPLIKTIMTRCIQCTRCVRFATEVAGVEEIGLLNRGEHAEISTIEKALNSELSGNLVDVCPVGALTSKPYSFVARPWELRKTQSVDVLDALGSNIRVDARGSAVLRILPRLHEGINEEWLADKSRYAVDGLRNQRLDRPYVRRYGRLEPASWDEAFAVIQEKLSGIPGKKIAAIAGDLCEAESLFALKQLMGNLGSPNLDCRQDGAKVGSLGKASYRFNTTLAGVEEAEANLLVGTNPRQEAPLLNARIRKRFLQGRLQVAGVGQASDLTYQVDWLGEKAGVISALAAGKHAFSEVLEKAERPMIIVGMGALQRKDGEAILQTAGAIAERYGMIQEGWNGFNVLHTAAARMAGLDMGFVPGEGGLNTQEILQAAEAGQIKALYLLGADNIDTSKLAKTFVIYQGHHGDTGAQAADVILPGAAYTEKNGLYLNTEGRPQVGRLAAFPPGDAREDWTILRALSGVLGQALPYDSLTELRQAINAAHPHFAAIDQIETQEWQSLGAPGSVEDSPLGLALDNYYMTDPISRASETMAQCTQVFVKGIPEADAPRTGTFG